MSRYNRLVTNMKMIKGVLEILQMAGGKEPKSFNDFTRISIMKKGLSSATVSKRLDVLVDFEVIEEVITRSRTGRRIIAYKTTEKGKEVVKLANEIEELLTAPKSKGKASFELTLMA